ncbi:MAG: M67 family metallopeptidase [Deltaproteobacteria bacterium]|nr:M67 family metallopeptidase [Deltaproteobacteria bacterium]
MTLHIIPEQLAMLHQHAEEGFPHEVVGILAGSREDWSVTEVVPLTNERADSAHNRYKVSGLLLMRAEQELESRGLEVVGYYHSHPDHPSQYSDYDRDHALPNMSYVIVSVMSGRAATTQSWRLTDDRSRMDEEELHSL